MKDQSFLEISTQTHQCCANHLGINCTIWLDRPDYRKWRNKRPGRLFILEVQAGALIDRRRLFERGVYSRNFNELNKTYKACFRRKFSPSNDISRPSLTLVFIAEAFLKQDYCIVNMLISGVYK